MSLFSGIEKAETYGAGEYLGTGTHELEVHSVTTFESKSNPGRYYFCVESDVVSSTSEEHAPGSRVTWLVNMSQPSALGNCLGFAMGLDPDAKKADVTQAFMDRLCSDEQPARGIRVRAIGVNIKTRAGNDFTKISWEAVA